MICVLAFMVMGSAANSYAQSLGQVRIDVVDTREKANSAFICFIFKTKEGFLEEQKALQIVDAKVASKDVTCEFNVPISQEYAISVLHDENGNRKLDKNAFGAPKEGWATTNNITHPFKAPEFEESKIFLKEPNSVYQVKMHY